MEIPRVRFTVRRLMVAVAVVGIAFYGLVLWRRSAEYRRLADEAERSEMKAIVGAKQADAVAARFRRMPEKVTSEGVNLQSRYSAEGTHLRRLSQDRARAKIKYRRAARYPWLPVAPDPPEPE